MNLLFKCFSHLSDNQSMQILKLSLLFTLLAFGPSLKAQVCNFKYPSNAKACPASGSTLLDDTYPSAGIVISVSPTYRTGESIKIPADFILKVLEGYEYSDSAPNIIVPAHPDDLKLMLRTLSEKVVASKGKIPSQALRKIVPVSAESYTWQQDYFESFVDTKTGKPNLRRIESYDRVHKSSVNNLVSFTKGCDFTEGEGIKTDHRQRVNGGKSFGNGEMGGNIEGLPGGSCLIGDNLSSTIAEEFCGKKENVLQMDVSWLTVGHVDEVFKVMPTNVPGVPKECNFSLMFASPKKAMDLLSESRAKNHPMFSGEFLKSSSSNKELESFRSSRSLQVVGSKLCSIVEKFSNPSKDGKSKNSNGAKQVFNYISRKLISEAMAAAGEPCEVEKLTNGEFLEAMKDPEFRNYNELVQKSLDESKVKIKQQVLNKLPHCKNHINIIDVPNLFYGTLTKNHKGEDELPRPGDGGSFLPNPTNSVITHKSVIFSDPQNPLFRDYLTQELKRKNMKASFIDTWEYSHIGNGNIHCSTHSIPFCSPAKGSK